MKKLLLPLALAATLLSTSCVGTNSLFRTTHAWNCEATSSKWFNELIHLGMWIIPVYEVTLLGDILIFNSIEFWGGKNPFSDPGVPKNQTEL